MMFVTNGISAEMGRAAATRDGYTLADVVLVKQRNVALDWENDCAEVIAFTGVAHLNLLGQVNQIGFYRNLLSRMRALLRGGTLTDIYLPNVDNLVNNHILCSSQLGLLPGTPRVSIIAEGLMNYQDIDVRDRAGWRWRIKPLLAYIMGLRYQQPTGHLSGAYEPAIARVFSYSDIGLKAPPERITIVPYPRVEPTEAAAPDVALLVMTGIAQWMTAEAFAQFKEAFVTWLNAQGFSKVLVKPHPNYPGGGIEEAIDRAEPLGDPRRLEALAASMPAATVIGYCSTGLVTTKMQRPDLRVIDWGSDFYCEHAYHGDRSVVAVFESAGVEIVEMGAVG
jgi:hypothetical protein